MKVLLSCILSLLVFLTGFQNSLILIDYHLNRAFYEENCINKNKPKMECHGKCQMQKEAEKKLPETKLVKINLEINLLPQKLIEAPEPEVWISGNERSVFGNYNENLLKGFRRRLLNPPQVLA